MGAANRSQIKAQEERPSLSVLTSQWYIDLNVQLQPRGASPQEARLALISPIASTSFLFPRLYSPCQSLSVVHGFIITADTQQTDIKQAFPAISIRNWGFMANIPSTQSLWVLRAPAERDLQLIIAGLRLYKFPTMLLTSQGIMGNRRQH